MKRKRGVTVYWGVLLIVYLAILFATTMIAVTADTNDAYLVVLLAAGIPIYVIISKAIMTEHEAASADAFASPAQRADANVVAFPERRRAETPAEIAQAAAEARAPRLRKLG